jgi:hypothetical protein
MILEAPEAPPLFDVRELLGLYDQNRYLDAYARTRDAWRDPSVVNALEEPRKVEEAPHFAPREAWLRASWYASGAQVLAMVRDFEAG